MTHTKIQFRTFQSALYRILMCFCVRCSAFPAFPLNRIRYFLIRKKYFSKEVDCDIDARLLFDYNHDLLPNTYLASVEKEITSKKTFIEKSCWSIGYPAWNLLYYTLLCSLPTGEEREAIVVETGTDLGLSTIILAQAIKDSGLKGHVHTVDTNEAAVVRAKENVEKAGLHEYVTFSVQDSRAFLKDFVKKVTYINLAFLDANHGYSFAKNEFSLVYPKIVACRGKVVFDNSAKGDIFFATHYIKHAYGGNMLRFRHCSWGIPGITIWQPE